MIGKGRGHIGNTGGGGEGDGLSVIFKEMSPEIMGVGIWGTGMYGEGGGKGGYAGISKDSY
jgi:hypothetical protein